MNQMQPELKYDFCTAWGPCEPVVDEMARQFPKLQIIHMYDEPGTEFAGKNCYKNGVKISSEYVSCTMGDDTYRRFCADTFGYEFYRCSDCGAFIYDWEVDEYGKCPQCGSKNIIDKNGTVINAFNYFKRWNPETADNGLLKVMRKNDNKDYFSYLDSKIG